MKNIKYFLSLTILFLMSCSDADDKVQKSNLIATGNWSLVKVSGSIAGINNNFPVGLITWNFNEENHTITIINNNANDALEDFFNSGFYNYSVINNSNFGICIQNIEIDGADYGCFTKTENKITISQTFADGFDLELIKQ